MKNIILLSFLFFISLQGFSGHAPQNKNANGEIAQASFQKTLQALKITETMKKVSSPKEKTPTHLGKNNSFQGKKGVVLNKKQGIKKKLAPRKKVKEFGILVFLLVILPILLLLGGAAILILLKPLIWIIVGILMLAASASLFYLLLVFSSPAVYHHK